MGYYIDLTSISIDSYKEKLKTAYLPPSRGILREQLDKRFGYIQSTGIENVNELLQTLKKKDSFAELSKVDCLKGDYLKILLRELNSSIPKPNRIKEFTGISADTVSRLEKRGIKNTVKLYEQVISARHRKELSDTTGINASDILELTKLTDLSRIRWVGVTFARMLYDLGYDTLERVSKADPVDLHKKINQLNMEKRIFKGHIGLNDIKICVEVAGEVPLEIDYSE